MIALSRLLSVCFVVLQAFTVAGCLDEVRMERLPVIEIEEHFSWNGDPRAHLQDGGHCTSAWWSDERLRVRSTSPLPPALAVRVYDVNELQGSRLTLHGPMGGDIHQAIEYPVRASESLALGRSFAEGNLTYLFWDGAALRVEGQLLMPGENATILASYDVNSGTITERTVIRYHPSYKVVVDDSGMLCI